LLQNTTKLFSKNKIVISSQFSEMVGINIEALFYAEPSTQLSVTLTLPSFFIEKRFGQNKSGCKPRAHEKMTHTTITPAPAANGVGHNFSFR
jgi:hypothetical protein